MPSLIVNVLSLYFLKSPSNNMCYVAAGVSNYPIHSGMCEHVGYHKVFLKKLKIKVKFLIEDQISYNRSA